MRSRQAAACVVVAVALAAAGCGSGSGDEPKSGGLYGQDGAGGDPRSAADRQADEAAARTMLLTADDVPAGFRAGPVDDSDDEDAAMNATLADCLNVSTDEIDPDNPKATSPTFATADDSQEIEAEVAFTPSAAAATKTMALLQSDDAPGCYEKAFKQEFAKQLAADPPPDGVEVGDPRLERLDIPAVGDEAVAFRLSIPLSQQGQDLPLYIDVLLVRVGRVGITTTFSGQGRPFEAGQAAELTKLVADRAPA